MARINIEDSIFKDIRFEDLKVKTGSLECALGALVRAWSIAQKFYLCEETSRLVPITEWKKQRINPAVLDCGLAEQRGEFVYVCGSEEQFKWLIQKQEAGKKGGRPPSAIKQPTAKPPALFRKAGESGSNPLTLSPSLSPSQKKENTYLQEIKLAWEVWTNTLKSFNVPESRISPQQESSIARAISTIGFENVIDALEGARHEPRTQTFDPSKVLRIDRVLHRDSKGVSRWEQFANLARQARQKADQETNRAIDLKNKALGIES